MGHDDQGVARVERIGNVYSRSSGASKVELMAVERGQVGEERRHEEAVVTESTPLVREAVAEHALHRLPA